jgi:hypothetical protein
MLGLLTAELRAAMAFTGRTRLPGAVDAPKPMA